MATSAARTNQGYGDVDREAKRKQEVSKAIKEAFALFDKDCKGVCDVREIGKSERDLQIGQTEIELRDMSTESEEEGPTGFIRFEKFERMMSRIMLENQYPRDAEDKLLRAFRTLDTENKGCARARAAPRRRHGSAAEASPRTSLPVPGAADGSFVEAEKLRNLLTTHGERFSQVTPRPRHAQQQQQPPPQQQQP